MRVYGAYPAESLAAFINSSPPPHNMTDHNTLRAHYRATSQKLAKRRQLLDGLTWLSLWLSAGLAAALATL